jgi:NDP-sugar pyrophosphorylase family protein
MKFAILSAGEGSRLAQEGVSAPKPLVRINGIPMIDRLLDLFMDCGAQSIVVIINKEVEATKLHLAALQQRYPLEVVIQTTAGSMESFYNLKPYLEGEKFCLTTVDTIFREAEFKAYIRAFEAASEDGYMAVTDYIDDEKPLYISTDPSLTITGYYNQPNASTNYISGGIYCLTPSCLDTLERCMKQGMLRMRQFQQALVEEGKLLKAYPFSKILDVDHAEDIAKAETFLQNSFQVLGVQRGSEYSPNKESNDARIFRLVKERLEEKGVAVQVVAERELQESDLFAPFVFSMARREESLRVFDKFEQHGAYILNAPSGIRNCGRKEMAEKLGEAGIPLPESLFMETDAAWEVDTPVSYPCWIKKGDGYAQTKEDVCFVNNADEAEQVFADLRNRKIASALIYEHLEGDLIKFYGVGTDFFYWYYPSLHESKFGLEVINGNAKGYAFEEQKLIDHCAKAAASLHLSVFGGDAVISPEGAIRIIDFNDWPSFGPCQEEAAKAIAQLVLDKMNGNGKE